MLAAAAPRVEDDELQMKEFQREYFDFLDDGKRQGAYIDKVNTLDIYQLTVDIYKF